MTWQGDGASGLKGRWQELWSVSKRVGESKRNSFGMFSLHGCTGKSTTVKEKRYSFMFLRQWPFHRLRYSERVKRWEVNGGLTLWFKQGTRPVSLTHVCRGRCYTSTDEQKKERAKERRRKEGRGGKHHLFIHLIIHLGRAKRTNLWYSLVSLL